MLASAARFIAGWPPGQALATEHEVVLRFLVDDWSEHAQLRDALSTDGIFPAPSDLLELRELPALPDAKVPRLHGIADEPRLVKLVSERYARSSA